jgi:hypothetical protein
MDAKRVGREVAAQLMFKALFGLFERQNPTFTAAVFRASLEEALVTLPMDDEMREAARGFIAETLS